MPKRPRRSRSASRRGQAGAHIFAAEYFAEEVRREINERYGEKKLYEGGLSVRTSLDPKCRSSRARRSIDHLVKFDEAQGWRGPVRKVDTSGDWGTKLADVKALNDMAPWRLAVVLATGDQAARIGLQPPRDGGGYVSKERQHRQRAARRREMGKDGRGT